VETLVMLKTAYGDTALSKTCVYEWFQRFRSGEMSIEDQHRSGRPSMSRIDENVKKIHTLVLEDRHRINDELLSISWLSWSSIQRILSEDLNMRRVADNWFHAFLQTSKGSVEFRPVWSYKISCKRTQNFFPKLLLVMKHGAMDMTPK